MTSAAPSTTLRIPVDGGELPVPVWLPPGGTGPGVVLVQEIFGLSPYMRDRAADLAAAGYVVALPDLYWRLGEPPLDEAAPDLLTQGVARMNRLPWESAVADTAATVRHLRAAPEVGGGVGLLGFCYGGGVAVAVAATAEVDVLVSYYGSALPTLLEQAPELIAKLDLPSLYHFGESDSYIPLETVRQIEDAVTAEGVQFHTYPGADHAFDNSRPEFWHPQASALAWQRTLAFLHDRLAPAPQPG